VIPEMDIWRAAALMLKRYGEQTLEESAAAGRRARVSRRWQRRGDLAPHYGCRYPARGENPVRPGPLIRRLST
jgi:hypothetical protein